MKLAAQYTRASMLVTVIVLLLAGGVYYFAIGYISNRQFDRDLTEEFGEMSEFIQQHQRFPRPFEFDSYQAKFVLVGQYMPARFADTVITGPNKSLAGRAIVATIQLKGQNYRMTIVESKESTDDLVQLITLITCVLTLILLIALFFTNRILLNDLWKPFYNLLDRLGRFSITGMGDKVEQPTKIEEFVKLQTAIHLMEQRTAAEYETLKSFTENASHEMMTPVAVITSKLDNLIQDESLNEDQLMQLQDIYNAGSKLSRLGQSLLLLVKIDHQLINDVATLQLDILLKEKALQFSELIAEKRIILTSTLHHHEIVASPYLIDILLNNLIGNAIRHNLSNGNIKVTLDKNRLVIANTGQTNKLDSAKIFERFQKSPTSDGTGLGLTIARNICLGYGWQLDYIFGDGYHTFTVTF